MVKQSADPYLAFLHYRATPLPWCELSPAELLMGRCLRTCLPVVKERLLPKCPHLERFRELNTGYKEKQKREFNKRHRTKDMAVILSNTNVWITSDGEQTRGTVTSSADSPRLIFRVEQFGETSTTSRSITSRKQYIFRGWALYWSALVNYDQITNWNSDTIPSVVSGAYEPPSVAHMLLAVYSLNGEMWYVWLFIVSLCCITSFVLLISITLSCCITSLVLIV